MQNKGEVPDLNLVAQTAREAAAGQPTLVVVDVQEGYMKDIPLRQRELLLQDAEREILLAMENQMAIVFVEYPRFGKTVSRLTNIVKNRRYARVETVHKCFADGSEETIDACERNGFNSTFFRVIGIFTHDCVFQTARGFLYADAATRVDLVTSACFPTTSKAFQPYKLMFCRERLRFVHVSN